MRHLQGGVSLVVEWWAVPLFPIFAAVTLRNRPSGCAAIARAGSADRGSGQDAGTRDLHPTRLTWWGHRYTIMR